MRKEINPSPTAKIIIGSIGVLYGTVRLLTAIIGGLGPAQSGSAYQMGQIFGLVVAAAVLFFGARYALRGLEERKAAGGNSAQLRIPVHETPRPAKPIPGSTAPSHSVPPPASTGPPRS